VAITIGSVNCPDIFYSSMVSQLYDVDHIIRAIPPKDINGLRKECEELFKKLNFKRSRGIGLPMFSLYKIVSEYTNKVISGDGLDEIAAGYSLHQNPVENMRFWHLPVTKREKLLVSVITNPKNNIREKRLTALEYTWKIMPETYLLFMKKYARQFDVEVRLPYLDERVITTLNKVPLEEKVDSSERKKIIKKIAVRYLPPQVVHREKLGLPRILREFSTNYIDGYEHTET